MACLLVLLFRVSGARRVQSVKVPLSQTRSRAEPQLPGGRAWMRRGRPEGSGSLSAGPPAGPPVRESSSFRFPTFFSPFFLFLCICPSRPPVYWEPPRGCIKRDVVVSSSAGALSFAGLGRPPNARFLVAGGFFLFSFVLYRHAPLRSREKRAG